MIQLTLIQIDNYGPWTTTPLPKIESYLQKLQAEIYQSVQKEFSERKALVLPMRYDNMIALSNGVGEKEHMKIMQSLKNKFPVSISMSVASAKTPYEAQAKATRQLTIEGGAKHDKRKSVLKFENGSDDEMQVAHIDINGITEQTDSNVYDSYERVIEIEKELIRNLKPKGALVFFMGGDNFVVPCNGASKEDFAKAFNKIEDKTKVRLKAGIGVAKNAEDAVYLASMGLKEIRRGAKEKIMFKVK